MDPKASLDVLEYRKYLACDGNRIPDRATRSVFETGVHVNYMSLIHLDVSPISIQYNIQNTTSPEGLETLRDIDLYALNLLKPKTYIMYHQL